MTTSFHLPFYNLQFTFSYQLSFIKQWQMLNVKLMKNVKCEMINRFAGGKNG